MLARPVVPCSYPSVRRARPIQVPTWRATRTRYWGRDTPELASALLSGATSKYSTPLASSTTRPTSESPPPTKQRRISSAHHEHYVHKVKRTGHDLLRRHVLRIQQPCEHTPKDRSRAQQHCCAGDAQLCRNNAAGRKGKSIGEQANCHVECKLVRRHRKELAPLPSALPGKHRHHEHGRRRKAGARNARRSQALALKRAHKEPVEAPDYVRQRDKQISCGLW